MSSAETLHDARHGHGSGQDEQPERARSCSRHAISEAIPTVGTTTFRPPYTPGGPSVPSPSPRSAPPRRAHPSRRTALHHWHERNSAVFVDAGEWRRPCYYLQLGENAWAAVKREMQRRSLERRPGRCRDAGKDRRPRPGCGPLLDRMYGNSRTKLAIGQGRYGLMLREDGMVFDDGVVMRIADNRFHVTTSTAIQRPCCATWNSCCRRNGRNCACS